MFTGLVEEMGHVLSIEGTADRGARLKISAQEVLSELRVGDSIAVNGACLTATQIGPDWFVVDMIPETLRVTCLGSLRPGDRVNLERSLALGSRLGGHLVQGHVDACGIIRDKRHQGNTLLMRVEAPGEIMRFLVPKGSIAVDGVSLTVMQLHSDGFTISLIPHTASVTTLGFKQVGDLVHLEADMIGKYVERLLAPYQHKDGGQHGAPDVPLD